MFAYTAPVPPFGGLVWQEEQLSAANGDPAVWHVVHRGAPETGDVPVTAWQTPQFAVNAVLSTE
jgi:hypothetical protein